MIAVVSALSVGNPFLELSFEKSKENDSDELKEKMREQKKMHEKWKNPVSDLLTWLNAIGAHAYAGGKDGFCFQHFLHTKVRLQSPRYAKILRR